MTRTCPQIQSQGAGETCIHYVSFADDLRDSETISSISAVSQQSKTPSTADNLTIASDAINGAVEILGESVAASESIKFTVSGGTAGASYVIRSTVVTSGGQTRYLDTRLNVV